MKDAYLLPINQGVYEELEHALKNQFYKTKLRVRIDYNNYLSKKIKQLILMRELITSIHSMTKRFMNFNLYKARTIHISMVFLFLTIIPI
ncbi:hypothetical protein ABAL111652_02440 [Abyssicoccus albus]